MCSEIALRFPTVVQTAAPFSPTRPGQSRRAGLKGAARVAAKPPRHDEVGGADLALGV